MPEPDRLPRTRTLSSPRIYLIRMAVFLVLVGFVGLILGPQLVGAFRGNPGLNGLIFGVLAIGIVLAVRQVQRLFREVRWVNHVSGAAPRTLARPPILLAPMAATLGDGGGPMTVTLATARQLLDSIGSRLDENRELVRYLAGLLVFLGLLGTFWGLIETVNSVGRIIGSLRGGADAAVMFDDLKTQLAAPLSGMGVSFSASLFGLAGSLVLGFLDLQAGQAGSRFYTELEDWLTREAAGAEPVAAAVSSGMPGVPADLAGALDRLGQAVAESGSGRAATQAMASLAEGVQGLVQHLRAEREVMREWADAQAARDRQIRTMLDRLSRESAARETNA